GRIEYINKLMKPGDLVVDLDHIFASISGLPLYEKPQALLPFACEARDALLKRLTRPSGVVTAWIIAGAPTPKERNKLCHGLSVQVTVLATPQSSCMRRILADPDRKQRGAEWRKLVDAWWGEWKAQPGDRVITGAIVGSRPGGGTRQLQTHTPGPAR